MISLLLISLYSPLLFSSKDFEGCGKSFLFRSFSCSPLIASLVYTKIKYMYARAIYYNSKLEMSMIGPWYRSATAKRLAVVIPAC